MSTLLLHRGAVSVLLLLSLSFAGCLATPPVAPPLPPGITIEPVAARLLPHSPVAVSPDGSLLALVRREGHSLRPLTGGTEKVIAVEVPVALAFNPSGTELAAAFVAADGSRLLRYATSNGAVLGGIFFPGRCEALLSREGEWLAFVTTLDTFRFGGNLRSRLLRWDGVQAPSESALNDTTLDRSTLAAEEELLATLQPQLSPYGDEILFLRLHDPPAFDPFIEVVLHHIEAGSDRVVVRLPQLRGTAAYLDGGESVAFADGNMVKIIDPWSEKVIQRLARPGHRLAAPPAGGLLWVDETLLRRDGQLLLNIAKSVRPVSFLGDGRLLLRDKTRLWLLSGLPAVPSERSAPNSEELRLLRKWRAAGLIDVREYAERVGR